MEKLKMIGDAVEINKIMSGTNKMMKELLYLPIEELGKLTGVERKTQSKGTSHD